MNHPWPAVPLGEVLKHRKEFIYIDDSQEYKRCRIQLHAKGIVLRDLIEGARIKTKEQQVCRAGEFLVAEIDAKVGGFGIVPNDLDQSIVSSHYFLFEIDPNKLHKRFLDYYIRTPTFRDQVSARGTTNYAAIRPRQVLEYLIPLPPLPEQWRIVAKIEALAAKVGEARRLRGETYQEAKTLMETTKNSVFSLSHHRWINKSLEEVSPINMGQSPPGHSYNTHGEGIPLLNGPTEFGDCNPIPIQWTSAPTKLCKKGDILLCVRGATTGRMNWADRDYCIGRGLAALTVDTNICDPRFVYHFVENQTHEMLSLSAGSTFPNLPGAKLKSLQIPVPPPEEQRRIVAYLDGLQVQVDALKKLQAQTAAELDALLPALLDKAFKGEL